MFIPWIWKLLISRHSFTLLGWIKWRKNAICIIGIKVNFSEKQCSGHTESGRVTAIWFVKASLCTVL